MACCAWRPSVKLINPNHHNQRFSQSQSQLDNVRKMLVAMIDDVRIALIKLAERTFAIRELKDANDERQQRVAREIFDVYAPLAHRLGIGHIKWELEDLSFRYLEPDAYKHIARLLDEKRLQRDSYIQNVTKTLKETFAKPIFRPKYQAVPNIFIPFGAKCSAKNSVSMSYMIFVQYVY
jgi:GTP pyrophosphokinase